MKFKNILISAGLSLVLGICTFSAIGANKSQKVSADPEETKTITFDNFEGLLELSWPNDTCDFTSEGYAFKGRGIDTDKSNVYGYDTGTGFSFRGFSSYLNSVTKIPGNIVSVTLYTFSCQKISVNYSVSCSTTSRNGQVVDNSTSYTLAGGQNHTFVNSVSGASYFNVFCDNYNEYDNQPPGCVDKIVVEYVPVAEDYKLFVVDEHVTSDNTSGDGWSYDPDTNTLNLNNFTFDDDTPSKHSFTYQGNSFDNVEHVILYYGDNETFTINVTGENNINLPKDGWTTYGIAVCANLVIKGDGELNIVANHDYYTWAFFSFFHHYYQFTETVKITTRSIVTYGCYVGQSQQNSMQSYFYFGEDVTLDMTAVSRNVLPIRPAFSSYHYELGADFGLWEDEAGTQGRALFKGGEPLPLDYNDGLYRRLRYPYYYNHDHNWSYTADGNKITATCNGGTDPCEITEGLTLTLNAPTDLEFSKTVKVATFEPGYNEEAFPNPQIKYYKDGSEVTECVNVGKYTAKVTFGEATASVDFEIVGAKITDPENPDVTVEIDDAPVPDNIELRVELKTDVAEKDNAEDYAKIQQMLKNNEKIARVYDVKLVQIVGGVETEIQPSDIKPGLLITVRMAIPEGIDINNSRILHIHNADDMEFVSDYDVDGNDLLFKVGRLSQFAFVTDGNGGGGGGSSPSSHGFCFGIILMILNILITLAGTFYVLLRLNILKIEKLNALKEKLMNLEVLLTFITACALIANFILDLIVLIVHACPFTVIAFILGILLLGGIMYWYIRTRREGEMTPVEEKSVGKVFKKKKNN